MLLDRAHILRRRAFLKACLALPAGWVLAACAGQAPASETPQVSAPTTVPPTTAPPTAAPTTAPATAPPATSAATSVAEPTAAPIAQALPATPPCGDDDDEPTPAQTEGPYYTPNTPERTSLIEPGITGTRLLVSGQVLTTACAPVAQALIDFWHCDDGGIYDNAGYRLRGHQFTDDQGRYRLETIMPGVYPGRTRHIHVKVQAPGQPVLTTQLYFPDEPANASDRIFLAELVMSLQDAPDGKLAAFNFVLNIA